MKRKIAVSIATVALCLGGFVVGHAGAATKIVRASGGSVTFTASVRNAKSCGWSSSPKIAGFAKTVKCKTGAVTRSARFTANTSTKAKSYEISLIVRGKTTTAHHWRVTQSAKSATVATTTTIPAATWSKTTTLAEPAGGHYLFLTAVSCPTATFCAAVGYGTDTNYGNSFDAVYLWNGASWSGPTTVDNGEQGLSSISCTSSSFCVAVGNTQSGGNYALTFNGSSWSGPISITPSGFFSGDLLSVSCVSSSFCMTVGAYGTDASSGYGYYDTWNGSSWVTGSVIDNEAGFTSVSCTAVTFCMAVDANIGGSGGNAYTWNGSSWSSPTIVDPPSGYAHLDSVSCATSTFCMAGGDGGNAYVWNGSSWSARTSVDKHYSEPSGLPSLSCPTNAFCMGIGSDDPYPAQSGVFVLGNAYAWNGSSWSGPRLIENAAGLTSVSCPVVSMCMAVDDKGSVYEWK